MTITYHIYNSIDKKYIMNVTMPWDYRKAVKGFYSAFWKSSKVSCASSQKLDKRFVKLQITRHKTNDDRVQIIFPSGLIFNSPFNLNGVDFKIINLHLEALELSKFSSTEKT